MKLLANFCRILVGCEFIFSGFVKVVDPYGTGLKLKEYFEVFAADLPAMSGFFEFLGHNSLGLSFMFCCLEFILGVALLFSFKIKYSAWLALVLMVFFTFLTFYSANFNKVTDCGCFGDFFKLKPWHSFYKDLISLILIIIIFVYRNHYAHYEISTPMVLISTVVAVGIGYYAIKYLPLLDFLPYAVGKNIPQQMQPPNIKPDIIYSFFDKKANTLIESKEYLTDTAQFKYETSETINTDELTPKITDFAISNDKGNDFTENTFTGNKFLFIIKNLDGIENTDFKTFYKLANKSIKKKVNTMVVTSLDSAAYGKLKLEKDIIYSNFTCDEKVLKTMARNNPCLILLKDGTVKGKWSINNLPDFEKVSELVND